MIVIIGAGISGLTLAYELQKQGKAYTLLEARDRAGGYIQTSYHQKTILEHGPGSILADPETVAYLEELGLKAELVYPESAGKVRYIFKNGKVRQMPDSPKSFFKSNFFSWGTKAALVGELLNRKQPRNNEETVGEFFERRFNKEIVDYAVAPFVSGIYAGDPYRLLINKTFPFLKKFETEHGSIIKGIMKSGKKGKKVAKVPLYFKSGMASLPVTIADKLDNIKYNAKVKGIQKRDNRFQVEYILNETSQTVSADKIVLALPAFAASTFLFESYPSVAEDLNKINYPAIVKVFHTFKKSDIGVPINGYGVLYPKVENKPLLGTLWNSSVYPVSSSSDEVLMTSIAGGVLDPRVINESDEEIMDKVLALIKETYQIKGGPVVSKVLRLEKAIPQYDKEMNKIDQLVKELEGEDMFVCANWHGGPSLTDCMRKAVVLAKQL
ncbi:protoporphyrinogen oxidase [Cytophagaceae bacterium ABcell3]|nr:protoporphyrinogen oxidase [Cytophagaceae bacterium ABcell3]